MKKNDSPISKINKNRFTSTLFFVIILLASGLLFAWYYFISLDSDTFIINNKNELSAIADFKAKQIINWRKERYADAVVIKNNIRFKSELNLYFQKKSKKKEVTDSYYWLKTFKLMNGYENIYMFDAFGNNEMNINENNVPAYSSFKYLIDSAKIVRKILFSSFYSDSLSNVHLNLVIPLFEHVKEKSLFIGSIVLEINPKKFIFSLLEYWPIRSNSSESNLITIIEDSIIFINESRFGNHKVYDRKISINDTNVLAVKAALGETGVHSGIDYRGKKVLGAISQIPFTKWYIVAKSDWDEIYSPLRERQIISLSIVLIFIAGSGLALRLYLLKQKAISYLKNYQIMSEKQSLSIRYEYLTKYANDIIFLIDDKLKIVEANEKAIQTYGYSKNEIINMPIINLRMDGTADNLSEIISKVEIQTGERYEIEHRKKDGSIIQVEISSCMFDIEGKRYYQEIIRDISERKEIEKQKNAALEALSKSEKYFRDVFEHAAVGKAINRFDGKIMLNQAFCNILGYSDDELSKINLIDITYNDDIERDQKIMNSILNKQCSSARWKKRYIRKNGSIVWVDMTIISQDDSNGNLLYLLTTIIDITEEINTLEALRRSQERFVRAMENIPDVITIYDNKLRIIFINNAAKYIPDLSSSDYIGKTDEEIMPPGIYQAYLPSLKESLQTKSITFVNVNLFFEGFGERALLITCIPILDENKEILEVIGITHDYTERNDAEKALRLKDELLEAEQTKLQALLNISSGLYNAENYKDIGRTINNILVEHLPGTNFALKLGLYYQDVDIYQIVYLSGEEDEDKQDSFIYKIKPCSLNDVKFYSKIAIEKQKALLIEDNHSEYSLSIDNRQKDLPRGSMLFIPLYNRDVLIGLLSFARSPENSMDKDFLTFFENIAKQASTAISKLSNEKKRNKVEQEILKINVELEDRVNKRTIQLKVANEELEAFSYSVSHDLRSPLRHINGFIELLIKKYKSDIPEKGLHYLNNISDSARQMGELIDNLLHFSRTGRAELKPVESDMNTIVRDALESLHIENQNPNIEWIIGKLPIVSCDYKMLKLVWINLFSNAVKYSRNKEKPRIEIGVQESEKEFIFFTRDNGVGFDMQYAQKLFGVFQRLHSIEEFEGTGIGLANVRRIIARHDGRTWAEAELNKGATFYFSLPKK